MTTTRKFLATGITHPHSPDELFTQLVVAMGEVAEAQSNVNQLAHEVVVLEAGNTSTLANKGIKKRRMSILRGLNDLDQALQGLSALCHSWHEVIVHSLEPTDAGPA